jgi:hypothetical protein
VSVDAPIVAAALRAAARGWRCFPCNVRTKRPLVHWLSDATTDPAEIRRLFSGPWSDAALACIVPDGIIVIDVDPRHGGDVTMEELEAEHGALTPTLTALTGGGGSHSWYGAPDTEALRQGDSVVGKGIDSRVAGRGYVILPPSRHKSGGRYRWAGTLRTIAPAPEWLLERLAKPPVQLRAVPEFGDDRAERRASHYGARALDAECTRVRASEVGTRNRALYTAAIRMGQLAAEGILGLDVATAELTRAGSDAGLDDHEISATVNSGLGFGLGHGRASR